MEFRAIDRPAYVAARHNNDQVSSARTNAGFEDTRWTTVVDVVAGGDSPAAAAALEHLCRAYWPPVYAVLRKTGHAPADAEDLCQGFFVHLMRNQRLSRPSREHGKFRSWLLACLKHYTCNEYDRQNAPIRHPRDGFVSWEAIGGGEALIHQVPAAADVDLTFDSVFAHRLVTSVRADLRAEYSSKDKEQLFDALEPFLTDVFDGESTARTAVQFKMAEGAIRVAHSRLKQRFGELLRQHVRQLVLDPAEVDAEIRHLLKAWLRR